MKKIINLFLVSGLALLASCSRVEEKKAAAQQPSFIVINVLDKSAYDDAHIKGSIHVPFMELTDFAQPLDRQTEIVVHCSNYACSASGSAAKQLRDMGFTKAWAYEGGMAEWYQMKLPTEGPATQGYLTAENKKMETDSSTLEISVTDLKKKMEEHKLI